MSAALYECHAHALMDGADFRAARARHTHGVDAPAVDEPATDEPSGETVNDSTPYVDPEGPQLVTNSKTLGIEDYFYLEAKMPDGSTDGITYVSSDSSIAKVYKSGRVTGRVALRPL